MKKIMIWIFILVLFLTLGFIAGKTYNELDISKAQPINKKLNYNYVLTGAYEMDSDISIVVNGTVEIDKDYYMENIMLSRTDYYKEENLKVAKGSFFKKGDTLYVSNKGERIKGDFNGKFDRVIQEEDDSLLRVINCDKLYYKCYVDFDELEQIRYDSKCYYYDNNFEKQPCHIIYIGSEIDDNNEVEIDIVCDGEDTLPGFKKSFNIVTEDNVTGLFIGANAVKIEGNHAYVIMKENDDYVNVEIKVGRRIDVDEDGVINSYYEILNGINKDSDVYIEIIKSDNADNIDDVLEE